MISIALQAFCWKKKTTTSLLTKGWISQNEDRSLMSSERERESKQTWHGWQSKMVNGYGKPQCSNDWQLLGFAMSSYSLWMYIVDFVCIPNPKIPWNARNKKLIEGCWNAKNMQKKWTFREVCQPPQGASNFQSEGIWFWSPVSKVMTLWRWSCSISGRQAIFETVPSHSCGADHSTKVWRFMAGPCWGQAMTWIAGDLCVLFSMFDTDWSSFATKSPQLGQLIGSMQKKNWTASYCSKGWRPVVLFAKVGEELFDSAPQFLVAKLRWVCECLYCCENKRCGQVPPGWNCSEPTHRLAQLQLQQLMHTQKDR